jgi:hypothetical protein
MVDPSKPGNYTSKNLSCLRDNKPKAASQLMNFAAGGIMQVCRRNRRLCTATL